MDNSVDDDSDEPVRRKDCDCTEKEESKKQPIVLLEYTDKHGKGKTGELPLDTSMTNWYYLCYVGCDLCKTNTSRPKPKKIPPPLPPAVRQICGVLEK